MICDFDNNKFQVKIIAKSLMSEKNASKAIEEFRVHLQTRQFFYDNDNKTRKLEQTYLECYDDASAQKHCPRRFKAMSKWLRSAKQVAKRPQFILKIVKQQTLFQPY